MKQDLERKEAVQSAFNSDTRAFSEKLELLQRENADKEDKLRQVTFELQATKDANF